MEISQTQPVHQHASSVLWSWVLLTSQAAPTHLNEQAGEFGWQLSSSCFDVMLHQEAHAPDPTHRDGDLWGEERARQGGTLPLPQSNRDRLCPGPRNLQDPGPSHKQTPPTYTTSHPRLLDKLSCRQVALAMTQTKPVSRLPRSGVQRPSDLEGTCRCSHPNSSLFTDDGTESQDQVVAQGHR